tara:strand:+ start:2740 stop:3225 length:486 start_codon:yes stop_codon:yes gene_type:complete
MRTSNLNKTTHYPDHQTSNLNQLLEQAAEALAQKYKREGSFTNAENVKEYLKLKLGGYDREVFALMLLDNQHQLIHFEELFFGTIDAASVYSREVVKAALNINAAAVILAHNHPSGIAEPSQADKQITSKLVDALALIDIRVLDHIVVGESCVSFAERGWL